MNPSRFDFLGRTADCLPRDGKDGSDGKDGKDGSDSRVGQLPVTMVTSDYRLKPDDVLLVCQGEEDLKVFLPVDRIGRWVMITTITTNIILAINDAMMYKLEPGQGLQMICLGETWIKV